MITKIGDVLLIYRRKEPVAFARVEDITADVKPGWWQLHLLFLNVPPQPGTWILREEYIDGGEFTMGGEPLRLERLPGPGASRLMEEPEQEDMEPVEPPAPSSQETKSEDSDSKVVNLFGRKNKD